METTRVTGPSPGGANNYLSRAADATPTLGAEATATLTLFLPL
jgi:hypothetical protein